jgi:hypothetical protein
VYTMKNKNTTTKSNRKMVGREKTHTPNKNT